MTSQQKTIIILGAILLAVLVGSAVIFMTLPEEGGPITSQQPSDAPLFVEEANTPSGTTQPSAVQSTSTLDTRIFQQSAWQKLRLQLITEGRLPVEPPTAVGKSNPFL